jgi:RND family efflux transporter MFP subunit
VKIGETVDVLVKAVSEEPLPGTVKALAPAPAAGSLTYPVVISLENTDASVKPGMFAEVTIEADKVEGVIAVPLSALMIKSGRQVIAIIDPDDQVVFSEVVTGVDNGDTVEIKSGIAEGDRIVIEGQKYLEETSQINIVE